MDAKITVLVSEELRREAKVAAAMHGVTLSEIVRAALEKYVEEFGNQETGESAKGQSRGNTSTT